MVKLYFYYFPVSPKAHIQKLNFDVKSNYQERLDSRAKLWALSYNSMFEMFALNGTESVFAKRNRLGKVFAGTIGKVHEKEWSEKAENAKSAADKQRLLKWWMDIVVPFRGNLPDWDEVLERLFLEVLNYERMTSEKSLKSAGHLAMCKDATEELVLLADATLSAGSIRAFLRESAGSSAVRPLNPTRDTSSLKIGDMVMVRWMSFDRVAAKVAKVIDPNFQNGPFIQVQELGLAARDSDQVLEVEKDSVLKIEMEGDGLLTLFCKLETDMWWSMWERNNEKDGQSTTFDVLSPDVQRIWPAISNELHNKDVKLDDNLKVKRFLIAMGLRRHAFKPGMDAEKLVSKELNLYALLSAIGSQDKGTGISNGISRFFGVEPNDW